MIKNKPLIAYRSRSCKQPRFIDTDIKPNIFNNDIEVTKLIDNNNNIKNAFPRHYRLKTTYKNKIYPKPKNILIDKNNNRVNLMNCMDIITTKTNNIQEELVSSLYIKEKNFELIGFTNKNQSIIIPTATNTNNNNASQLGIDLNSTLSSLENLPLIKTSIYQHRLKNTPGSLYNHKKKHLEVDILKGGEYETSITYSTPQNKQLMLGITALKSTKNNPNMLFKKINGLTTTAYRSKSPRRLDGNNLNVEIFQLGLKNNGVLNKTSNSPNPISSHHKTTRYCNTSPKVMNHILLEEVALEPLKLDVIGRKSKMYQNFSNTHYRFNEIQNWFNTTMDNFSRQNRPFKRII